MQGVENTDSENRQPSNKNRLISRLSRNYDFAGLTRTIASMGFVLTAGYILMPSIDFQGINNYLATYLQPPRSAETPRVLPPAESSPSPQSSPRPTLPIYLVPTMDRNGTKTSTPSGVETQRANAQATQRAIATEAMRRAESPSPSPKPESTPTPVATLVSLSDDEMSQINTSFGTGWEEADD